jgi:hypothetical protein
MGKHFSRFSQTTDTPTVFLVRCGVIVLLIVTGLLHFRAAFLTQLAQNQGEPMAAFSHSITDPDALASMAREEHLRNADLPTAELLYKRALENFALHLPSWLGIAEVWNDQGKINEAVTVLEFIHNRFHNGADTIWSKTLLASTLGQEQILTENLIWLASNSPQKRKDVFALATISWEEPDALLNKFGSAFYADILKEYIRHNEPDKTMTVWDKMVGSGSIQQDVAVQYIDYLVGRNAFSQAAKVWSDIAAGQERPLLHDGDFAQPMQGSGFGWRISPAKGVSWRKGEYGRGLEITFDGTENVAFQLSQLLPLEPGRYIFQGSVATDHLTTDQLPFWKIQGEQCTGLSKQGEMLLPHQPAADFVIPFLVPQQCEVVRISLLRRTSYHFDNKINGKIIVNNLQIRPQEESFSLPEPSSTPIPSRQEMQPGPGRNAKTNISIDRLSVQP